MGVLKNIHLLQ